MAGARVLPGICFVIGALLMLNVTPAQAGSANLQAGVASFVDPSGTDDRLNVNITSGEPDQAGWRANFFDPENPVAAGAGCSDGAVGIDCLTGLTAPGISIDLGSGADQLALLTSPVIPGQAVRVKAGPGDDEVSKYQTAARVNLGPGDDTIEPDDGGYLPAGPSPGDVIRGGRGVDTVDYSSSLDPIDVSLDGRPNDGRKGERDNVLRDVENVIGSEYGGTLIGSARANRIYGPAAERRLVGGGGRDRLEGSGLIDALDARGGDRVRCLGDTDIVHADAGDLVAKDCARVKWAPAVRSVRRTFRTKRVRVKLACPAASRGACAGKLKLIGGKRRIAVRKYRIARAKRRVVILRVKRRSPRKATLFVVPNGSAPIAGRAVRIKVPR